MSKLTPEQYDKAFDVYLYGGSWTDAMRGTGRENDPRLAAYIAAREGLADLLFEMHEEAEEAAGQPCKECRLYEADRARREREATP